MKESERKTEKKEIRWKIRKYLIFISDYMFSPESKTKWTNSIFSSVVRYKTEWIVSFISHSLRNLNGRRRWQKKTHTQHNNETYTENRYMCINIYIVGCSTHSITNYSVVLSMLCMVVSCSMGYHSIQWNVSAATLRERDTKTGTPKCHYH